MTLDQFKAEFAALFASNAIQMEDKTILGIAFDGVIVQLGTIYDLEATTSYLRTANDPSMW